MKKLLLLVLCLFSVVYAKPLSEKKIRTAFEVLYQNASNPNFYAERNAPAPEEPSFECFHLELKNIRPGTKFDIYGSNLFGVLRPNFLFSGFIDATGDAFVYRDNNEIKLSNVEIAGTYLRGEPIFFYFVPKNSKTYVIASYIAKPIEQFGPDGQHVWMELTSPLANGFIIRGENFNPNENINIKYTLNGIERSLDLIATKEGFFGHILNNHKLDYIKTEAVIATKNGEDFHLPFEWGFSPNLKPEAKI